MRHMFSIRFVLTVILFALHVSLASGQGASNSQTSGANSDVVEAQLLSIQVVKLYQEGNINEAIPLAKKALKLREKAFGPSDRSVADAAANVALLYIAIDKLEDAEGLLKRVVAIYEKEPDKDNITLARALDNLGSLYLKLRDYKKAVASLQRAASLGSPEPGKSSRELGIVLQRLACAQYKLDESAAAEQTEARANHILYAEAAAKSEPPTLDNDTFACRVLIQPVLRLPPSAFNAGPVRVVVDVEVDETGRITSAHMVTGPSSFRKAMETAWLSAKVRPLLVDRRPVRFRGVIVSVYAEMRISALFTMTR